MIATPDRQGTYQSSANATTHTVTFGFTPTAGSLLVICACISNAGSASSPGWTARSTSGDTIANQVVLSKIADGTETSAVLTAGASTWCVAWVGAWNVAHLGFDTANGTFTTGITATSANNSVAAGGLQIACFSNASTNAAAWTPGTATHGFTEQTAFVGTTGGTAANIAVATHISAGGATNCAMTNGGNGSTNDVVTMVSFLVVNPTPIFICGAECGIAILGTASAGVEHWSAISGAPTIVTSGPATMRSTRCLRFNPSASLQVLTHTYASAIASPATVVGRFYIYFATKPNANCTLLRDGSGLGLHFTASDGSIRGGKAAGTQAASGYVVSTGVWYRVDFKIVVNTTSTVDFQVDDAGQTQYSVAGVAATGTTFDVGVNGVSVTGDVYFDDIILSGTSADYPIGAGKVVGLYPNGDLPNSGASGQGNGGHLFSATTDFGKGSGGATATGAQNVESTSWQSLTKPLPTSVGTNFIADLLGASTEYLVWTTDVPPPMASVNGAMCVAATHSAATTANDFYLDIWLPAALTLYSAFNHLDLSETTITYPIAVVGAGTISVADIIAFCFRFGLSNDVNPDVYLDGVCLEVDYVPRKSLIAASPTPRRRVLMRR